MSKPTLHEVKEYFKNAKIVDGLISKFDISTCLHTLEYSNKQYWVNDDGSFRVIWDKQLGYTKIISYKEPLYQITAKEIVHAFENPQYLKEQFKECFETDLEVGKWYKSDKGSLFNHQNNDSYGFHAQANQWVSKWKTAKNLFEHLEPATEKEVEEALIKEARKRYNKNDSIQSLWKTIIGNIDLGFKNEFNLDKNEFWYGGYLVFKDGTWAKILTPTYTIQEAESKFNIKIKAV